MRAKKNSNYFKGRGLVALLLLIHLSVPSDGLSRNLQSRSAALEWPPITKQSKPWTRWWWLGNIVNKKDLTIEMEKYEKAG